MRTDAVNPELFDLLYDQAPLALMVNLVVPVLVSIPLAHEAPVSVLLQLVSLRTRRYTAPKAWQLHLEPNRLRSSPKFLNTAEPVPGSPAPR